MPASHIPELETELHYFSAHRVEFVERASGKFALIKGENLIGVFETEADAIRHGYQTLGNVPFLVRRIMEVDIPLSFTSFTLGV